MLLLGASGARPHWPASPSGSSGSARPRWLYTPCYIAMGWAAVFFLPDFMRTGGIAVLVLVIDRRTCSTARAACIYGIKRPNPSPRWFGFHEVFHSRTVAALPRPHYVGISLVAYQHG
ncbi:hemolysin III family protein [Streptomyces sp. L7]